MSVRTVAAEAEVVARLEAAEIAAHGEVLEDRRLEEREEEGTVEAVEGAGMLRVR
jgi:hypothetical protein